MQISSRANASKNTPVLIVGGSLVGLSTALFLSRAGVPSLLVERHSGSTFFRAGIYNARTMELFRMAGIEEAIRSKEVPEAQGGSVLYAESLAGRELGWLTDFFSDEGERSSSVPLPVRRSDIGQGQLERILQAQVRALGVTDLCFNTEFLSWTPDAEGITATIRERKSGTEHIVHARYLIAADGGRSSTRQQAGIAVDGPGFLTHQLRLVFMADMLPALRGRTHFFLCYVNNPVVRGPLAIFSREAKAGALLTPYHPELGEREEDFKGERGIELIRAAVGIPDLKVTLLDIRSWELGAYVAERFQQDHVFLVGDAAHVMPPSGGLGANTGIADAYNLAWKIALVIQGTADPALLSTYEIERRPVAQSAMEQAFARYIRLWADQPPGIQQLPDFPVAPVMDYLTIALGYRYLSPAIISSSDDHDLFEDPRQPTGRPGSYAAHLVLEKDGRQYSTRDLFGQQFILLTGQDGKLWCEAAREIARRLGLTLTAYCIGPNGDYLDVDGGWTSTYGVTTGGAVLVRPDGFIAWRVTKISTTPQQELEQALLRLLGCMSGPATI